MGATLETLAAFVEDLDIGDYIVTGVLE